ncbi:MAG TPA: hypothetical protein VEB59_07560, partial [Gemmatimonadales bacterium]|nr:hypothetical protein [Gemmatimonadales bacterium]
MRVPQATFSDPTVHPYQDPALPPSSAIQLVVGADPLLLLAQAAEAFLAPARATPANPFPSPPYLLALRQGGLRDDLIRLATERGVPGWFDPPLCTFQELPTRLGGTGREPCDDFERAVILGGALREIGGEVFGRLQRPQDFITVLDRLFGDLVSEGVRPESLRAALEARTDRDSFERNRDGELQLIYALYLEKLAGKARRDGRDNLLDCATAVAADPAAFSERLGGRREIRLFGLQDLRGGWREMLRALAGSGVVDRVLIYTGEELDLGLEPAPSLVRIEESVGLAGGLFATHPERSEGSARTVPGPAEKAPRFARDEVPAVPTVTILSAPDVERELEHVARRVRALADVGVPLHRIAVIARQARPYVDLALAALDRFGVPATARRRVSWGEIPIIRAVRSLLAAAAEGWTRHGLAELAEQPYFSSELDVRLVNYAGYRRRLKGLEQWRRSLEATAKEAAEQEEREARGEEPDERRRAPLPPSGRAREAADNFALFAERARELDEVRTLSRWLAWLQRFLHDDPWSMERRIWQVPAARFDIARLDLAGWGGVTRLVDAWSGALAEWGGGEVRLTAEQFYRQVLDVLEGDAALWTEVQRGVQVLEALAAAYRSFDHVFLVG